MKKIEKGSFNIVRQMSVKGETLKKIAELLDIPEAERDHLLGGTIYIETAPPSPRRRAARPATARAPRRPQK